MFRVAVIALFLGVATFAGTAHAFAEFSRFDAAVEEGGSAGRWFTGSPADGYGCAVCHIEGSSLDVAVSALPDRYEPGATYEIELSWPSGLPHVEALLEFTDERGNSAGQPGVPERSLLGEDEICKPRELGVGAAKLFEASEFASLGQRKLVGFLDCGATRFRFRWTAPAQEMGPIFFAGGVVAAPERAAFDQKDVYGDGFAQLFRPLLPPSQPAYVVVTRGGCTVAGVGKRAGSHAVLAGSVLALGACALRRRRKSPKGVSPPRSDMSFHDTARCSFFQVIAQR